jgi:CRP/FNR family transcriptional regulator, cyclic AMP receptor protein
MAADTSPEAVSAVSAGTTLSDQSSRVVLRDEEAAMTGATGAAALAASKVLTGGRPSDSGKLWASVLQELPLFAGVSKRHVRKIANLAKEARFSAGSRIVRRGEPGNAFFVILDGEASVVRVAGLPAVPLTVGDSFGEMALLDGGTRSATVVASTNVLCLRLSRAPFTKMLKDEPDIALAMLRELTRRLRVAELKAGA